MKYYHWSEGTKSFRSYLDGDMIRIEMRGMRYRNREMAEELWLKFMDIIPTATRGILGLAKIDHDVVRIGENRE